MRCKGCDKPLTDRELEVARSGMCFECLAMSIDSENDMEETTSVFSLFDDDDDDTYRR